MQSRQFLEDVLDDFEGTLLFVSHDRYFIDRLATKVWAVEQGELRAYVGNYSEYYRHRQQAAPPIPSEKKNRSQAEVKSSPSNGSRAHARKNGKVKVRTLGDVEQDVEKAEAHVKELEEAVARAALEGNAQQLTHLSQQYDQAREQVETLLAEWEQVAEAESGAGV